MKGRTIEDILKGFPKVELEDLGSILGEPLSPRLRKAELVERLTGYLTDHPVRWLSHLFERDIRLLKTLVHAGPGKVQYIGKADYPTVLELSGLVDSDDSDSNFHKVWLRREVYDIVAPHIDQAIRKGEKSGRFEVERVGLGYLNLYGILPVDHFVDLMADYYEQAFGPGLDPLVRILEQSPLVKVSRFTDRHGDYLLSPCVSDADGLFEFREEIAPGTAGDFRDFTPEEALEAGGGAPYFAVGLQTPEGKALTDALRQIGYSGFDLVKAQHDIWVEAQYPFDNEALFDPLTSREDRIGDDALYQSCLKAIVDYANRVPKWALCGFSAVEKDLLVLEQPSGEDTDTPSDEVEYPQWTMPRPTISEGYSDWIEKDENLERLSPLLPDGFPFGMAIPHVAPNDPCPCGSGLRYAHCHGKRMN